MCMFSMPTIQQNSDRKSRHSEFWPTTVEDPHGLHNGGRNSLGTFFHLVGTFWDVRGLPRLQMANDLNSFSFLSCSLWVWVSIQQALKPGVVDIGQVEWKRTSRCEALLWSSGSQCWGQGATANALKRRASYVHGIEDSNQAVAKL